jgi:hypothetical protein
MKNFQEIEKFYNSGVLDIVRSFSKRSSQIYISYISLLSFIQDKYATVYSENNVSPPLVMKCI